MGLRTEPNWLDRLLDGCARLQLAHREDGVLAAGMDLCLDLLGASAAAAYVGETDERLEIVGSAGDRRAVALLPDPGVVVTVLDGREVALLPGRACTNGDLSVVVAALAAGRRRLGALAVAHPAQSGQVRGDAWSPDPGDSVHALAVQLGLSLDRVRTLEALSRLAHEDELTGVGNRRHAVRLLESLRQGDAVLVVDVDDLKGVNDRRGHRAGDDVLVALAGLLADEVRDADAVARLGGDEFLVILRHCGATAASVAERIAGAWLRTNPVTTFSYGAAAHSGGGPIATHDTADAALIEAKHSRSAPHSRDGADGYAKNVRSRQVSHG